SNTFAFSSTVRKQIALRAPPYTLSCGPCLHAFAEFSRTRKYDHAMKMTAVPAIRAIAQDQTSLHQPTALPAALSVLISATCVPCGARNTHSPGRASTGRLA